jgi:hypothetical protein
VNALAIVRRLNDKTKVDRNTLIALSSLAGRSGNLLAKSDRGVLVTASVFKMMLSPNETVDQEEPRVISGHGLGPIVKASALNTVEDIGLLEVRIVA